MFKSGRGVLCTDFLVVLGHFGGRSFIYVVVLVGSLNSDFLFAELRSGKGDLRSTFEIDFGQKDLWEMATFVIAQDVCKIEFVG